MYSYTNDTDSLLIMCSSKGVARIFGRGALSGLKRQIVRLFLREFLHRSSYCWIQDFMLILDPESTFE